MANPQKENGFTAIANEILEKLVNIPLLGSEFQVILFILRKTYGFQKKSDVISLTQFEKWTGVSRPTVVKTIKNLVLRKMVVKDALLGDKISFSFNKNYEDWLVKPAKLVKHRDRSSLARLTKSSKARLTHKRNKEITKETSKGVNPLGAELIKLFEEVNPYCKKFYGNTTQRRACDELIETYGFEEVSRVIPALIKTNKMPFFPNITTPSQLLQKYQQLKDKWAQKKVELQTKGRGLA